MQGQNYNMHSHLPLGQNVRKIEQAQSQIRLRDQTYEEPEPASMSFARGSY